jgi:uncharacterized protein YggE
MATVTVRGTGNARTSEDEASVTLVTEAIEQTAAAALAKVAERTQAALDLCDTLGIEPSARVTAGASVAEHGEHDREGRWQHRGYRSVARLELRDQAASAAVRSPSSPAIGFIASVTVWMCSSRSTPRSSAPA